MASKRNIFAALVGCFVACACAGNADAFVSWTNTAGMTADFSWSGGGSDNGLFGDPTIVGNSFVFEAISGFKAESISGSAAQVSDRLEVTIVAKGAFQITDIRLTEFGES